MLLSENGMLHILDRNMRIKEKPEKFQESGKQYDVILTCEEKVYDLVIERFENSEQTNAHLAHVINLDVVLNARILLKIIFCFKKITLLQIDNPEEATIGAFLLLDLASKLESCEDLDDEIDEIVHDFEGKCDKSVLHTVVFY